MAENRPLRCEHVPPVASLEITPAPNAAQAVAEAFNPDAKIPDATQNALTDGRIGEEMLRVLNLLGGPSDPRALAEGLIALRQLGLEDIARRTALESLLLERRG